MAIIDNFTKEQLQKIVEESTSMKEVIDKLGYSTHSGSNHLTVKNRLTKYNISTDHFTSVEGIKRTSENVFIENSTASQATLRRWYFKGKYTPYVCSICGQPPVWQNKDLTLILDHINGINHDDRIENLRWVCPNCNQQLDTTNGKNLTNRNHITSQGVKQEAPETQIYCINCGTKITVGSKTGLCSKCASIMRRTCERPDQETLKQMIRTMSFTLIASKYNVTDNSVRKWCDSYKLPRTKKEINKYSDIEWEQI